MDFLKTARRKSLLSEVLYYSLNIGLAILLFVLSQTIQSPVLAIVLVLLSKWRVLAVRLRYWWTNIQANMLDIIVGVSIVTLMYLPQMPLAAQAALAIFYAIWLVVLKPLSKRWQMLMQSFVAVGLGVTALYAVSYDWPVFVVVLSMFAIGYSSARHFLYAYEEEQIVFLSAIWGLLVAEVGWLAYFWTYGYSLPGLPMLKIPQITIIALLLTFLGERVYRSWRDDGRIMVNEILPPAIFAAALISAMLIFLNSVII